MVKCFPLDYMHLVCLGVMRKLLWAWKRGSYQSRLRASEIDEISKFLVFICPFISCEFARKTRSVKELARWKATELRLFLLYVGPVVLKKNLPSHLYDHFMLLHVGIKILATDTLCREFNDYAKQLLILFVRQCKDFYGDKFLSYNVHNLIHLADDVLNFGPLDAFSAFPFENHLQSIKRLLRKHDKPLPQVIRRIQEIEKNSLQETNKESGVTVLKKTHTNRPFLNSCNGKQFKILSYKSWTLKTDNAADRYVILNDGKVVQISNLVNNLTGIHIIGKYFTAKEDFYTSPLNSTRLEISSVNLKSLSRLHSCSISSMKCKALLIPKKSTEKLNF